MRELERDRTQARGPRAGAVALGAITIVGAGRAGTAFAGAARAAGLEVRVAGRTEAEAAGAGSDVVLLCVPDAEIEAAAA
ncbi:MAG: Rossmann-like domain, partial [Solirubrobacterales bacterium]|nr:Rossmann-like domain [Solirubrobacterales bacterium]